MAKTTKQGPIKDFWGKYQFELVVLIGAFVLWKVRGIFSAVGGAGDALGAVVENATAGVKVTAKKSTQKAAIKAINPTASDADLDVFEDHARGIALCLGYLEGSYANKLIQDRVGALGIAKKYSHYIYSGSTIVTQKVGGKSVKVERKSSLRLAVLIPFYKECTGGRSLTTDLDASMLRWNDDVADFYKKIVK